MGAVRGEVEARRSSVVRSVVRVEGSGETKSGFLEDERGARAKDGCAASDSCSQNKMCCKNCDGAFPPQ